ncbi:MAG: sulfite exporter TauE/SafE family protein [Candidatus Micrarchaeota archaeon]
MDSILILIPFIALVCEYIDSTLGMGYGTTLTPLLLIMGFEPLQIVPSVLLSELITGALAAGLHHRVGNVKFGKGQGHLRIAAVLAICSVVGTVVAVFLAIELPKEYVKTYIGILVLVMGVVILWKRKSKHRFSWGKIVGLGSIASFNKGISGGGYGPVVMSGQILSGVNGKNAVAITSLAESLTCLVGVLLYLAIGTEIDWTLAPYLIIGAVVSVPLSAYSVKVMNEKNLIKYVGILTVLLGLFTLFKLFL